MDKLLGELPVYVEPLNDYLLNISKTILMVFIKTHLLISTILLFTILQSILIEVMDL